MSLLNNQIHYTNVHLHIHTIYITLIRLYMSSRALQRCRIDDSKKVEAGGKAKVWGLGFRKESFEADASARVGIQ